VSRELVEEEGDRRGGRVVTREEQREDLVAHLIVGEALALRILRLDQQPEDVLAGIARPPAARDLAEDDAVERLAHPAQPRERAARPAQHLKPVLALIEGEPALEGGGDVDPGAVWIETEERPHSHAHGHVPRPVVEVDPLTGSPSREGAVGLLGHDRRGRGDPLAVEDGDHDLPRAIVIGAVGGQEPVADQRDQVAEAAVAPPELVTIGDEDEAVRLGAEHEDVDGVEDADREDGAVLLVGGQEDRQRIAAHPLGAGDARQLATGRQRGPSRRPELVGPVLANPGERIGRRGGRDVERHGPRLDRALATWPNFWSSRRAA
jgi:hypothetical protein